MRLCHAPPIAPRQRSVILNRVQTHSVVLYHAQGCHLCERARDVLLGVKEEIEFDLREVDIGGDPELEARYREWLPVVEIDGRQAFTYHVHPDALRRRLVAQTSGSAEGL